MSEPAKGSGHAFLSYDPGDAASVTRLQRTLEGAGISVWRDTGDLWPGMDWRYEMRKAIADGALVFIACFSRASVGRVKSVQNEQLILAIDQLRLRAPGTVWLIPVRLDECVIPEWDIGGGRTLGSLQPIDLSGDRFEPGSVRLIGSIRRALGDAAPVPPPTGTFKAKDVQPVTFEVSIAPAGDAGKFKSEVLRSDAGEGSAITGLDLGDLTARCSELQQALTLSAAGSDSLAAETGHLVREVGEQLFAVLLGSGQVAGIYRANAALAIDRGASLRVVLRAEAPELAALPWEAMYDEVRGAYLARRDQLVRNLPMPTAPAPLQVGRPLRILGIASSPDGQPPVSIDKERDLLASALAVPLRDGSIEVDWAAPTWNAVLDRMLSNEWHVIHYVGHGSTRGWQGESVLILTSEDGSPDPIEAGRFTDLLYQAKPMPRLIVLNSCQGATPPARSASLFSATAMALIRGGACAVAAMQYKITDRASLRFARAFYTAIAEGRAVDEAVSAGRIGILGSGSHTFEWITPVLYLRNDQTRLFDRST
ncbi:MAG TPA: CHAT domain-containing protein [Streptosporangiaceae bacterium]|nr:CHAT domain-containing protein [Streptosporangiaceae bacterium]